MNRVSRTYAILVVAILGLTPARLAAAPTVTIERFDCLTTDCPTCPGVSVSLEARTTGNVVSHEWHMMTPAGEIEPYFDIGVFVYYELLHAGRSTVSVTVTDNLGATATASKDIDVSTPIALVVEGSPGVLPWWDPFRMIYDYNPRSYRQIHRVAEKADQRLLAVGWEVHHLELCTYEDVVAELGQDCVQGFYFVGHGHPTNGIGLSETSGQYTDPVGMTPDDLASALAETGTVLRAITLIACHQSMDEWASAAGTAVAVGCADPVEDLCGLHREYAALAGSSAHGTWSSVPPPRYPVPRDRSSPPTVASNCLPDTLGGFWLDQAAIGSIGDPYEALSAGAMCSVSPASPVTLTAGDGSWELGAYFGAAVSESVRVVAVSYRNLPWWLPPGSNWRFLEVSAQGVEGAEPDSVVARVAYFESELAALHIPSESILTALWVGVSGGNPVYANVPTRLDTVANQAYCTIPGSGFLYLAPGGAVMSAPEPGQQQPTMAVSPNPFRTSFTVEYAVERPGPVRLTLVDVMGRQLAVLGRGEAHSGRNHLVCTPPKGGLTPGVYYVRMEFEGRTLTRPVVLVE